MKAQQSSLRQSIAVLMAISCASANTVITRMPRQMHTVKSKLLAPLVFHVMKRYLLVGMFVVATLSAVLWSALRPRAPDNGLLTFSPSNQAVADSGPPTGHLAHQTIPRPAVSPGPLVPADLKPIIEIWSEVPDVNLVKRLTPGDLDVLVGLYQQETNLLKRRSMTLALAFAEEGRAVELFKRTLTEEFRGQPLTWGGDNATDELGVMLTTVEALGLLAAKHEGAYQFLMQGMDPLFWKEQAGWTTRDTADTYGVMASRCIGALGMSGRPEVPEFLNQLKGEPLVNTADSRLEWRRSFEGAVVDAAFWHDLVRERGVDYVRSIYGNEVIHQLFRQWKKTENGQQWGTWSQQRRAAAIH